MKRFLIISLSSVLIIIGGLWLLGRRPATTPTDSKQVCQQEQVEDIDGNRYSTLELGDQCWLGENLKTTTYRDGTDIPRPLANEDWRSMGNEKTGAYACYHNKEELCDTYGALYNAYAAVDQRLCPDGWTVPSDQDWKELEIYLGMDPDVADRLYWRGAPIGVKLAGHYHLWDEDGFRDRPEFGETGFDAAPAGYRMSNGRYSWLGHRANLWSSTVRASAWRRTIISSSSGGTRRTAAAKNFGFSVRCLQE